jgi:peptidyl-prolyl cis-trans isomerase SurA
MLKRSLIIGAISLGFLLTACNPKHSDIVLSKYDTGKVKMGEFEKEYAKSAGSVEKAKQDSISKYKDFLKLYTDYKLKLRNAWVRGYDEDPELQKEYKDYLKQIGESYITEKKIVEPALKKMYERNKEEVRVAHILIRTDNKPEKAAENLAISLIKRLQKGESFDSLARKYSEHSFTKNDGGDLYYITAGQILTPIEDAMYATPVGKVYPKPVKTSYGYHIIKVTDRRPIKYKIRASHILIKIKKVNGKLDTASAKARADSVYQKLKAGEDFAKLAKEYSDDKGSAVKGGDLGFFQRRMMVKPFDEAAFNLKKGEFSKPVETKFGFHIIKVTDIEPLPPFDKMKEKLDKKYRQTRYKSDYDAYVKQMKTDFGFYENNNLLKKLSDKTKDLEFKMSVLEKPEVKNLKDSVVIKVKDNVANVDTVIKFVVNNNQMKSEKMTFENLRKAAEKLGENMLFGLKAEQLVNTDSTFKALMDEYRNGLLIFKIQQEDIWDKMNVDSTKLKKMYEEEKSKLVTSNMVEFDQIYSRVDTAITNLYRELVNGASFDELADSIANLKKSDLHVRLNIKDKAEMNKITSAVFALPNPSDYTSPIGIGKIWVIAKLDKKSPSRQKSYKEALPELMSEYQDIESKRLKDEMEKRLENIYHVKFYYDELQKAYKPDQD